MSHTDADHAAADAVVAHHGQLAADLTRHVALLRAAARSGDGLPSRTSGDSAGTDPQWAGLRQDLLTWLRTELLPHAAAEEDALYPPAAAQDTGRLLVDGMVAEHRAIAGLVTELEAATTAVDAAGAARALSALFEVHLGKENQLVLPLLLATGVGLADILGEMHELLGEDAEPEQACGGHGCGCGGAAGSTGGSPRHDGR